MWQILEKLLGEAQHHCEICVCLQGLTIRLVKCFSFVFEAIATHEGKKVAEGKAVPRSQTSRQESSSYSPTAPLRCGWAPALGSALVIHAWHLLRARKHFFLPGWQQTERCWSHVVMDTCLATQC